VLIADGYYGGYTGTGSYRLTFGGDSSPALLEGFLRFGSQVALSGGGGSSNRLYVVLASTDVAAPLSLWHPVQTNRFGPDGRFTIMNLIDPSLPHRFFRICVP